MEGFFSGGSNELGQKDPRSDVSEEQGGRTTSISRGESYEPKQRASNSSHVGEESEGKKVMEERGEVDIPDPLLHYENVRMASELEEYPQVERELFCRVLEGIGPRIAPANCGDCGGPFGEVKGVYLPLPSNPTRAAVLAQCPLPCGEYFDVEVVVGKGLASLVRLEEEAQEKRKGVRRESMASEAGVVERAKGKDLEGGSAETAAFYLLENEIFEEMKDRLHCKACCGKGSLVKNGGAGTVAANGVQRLQLKCIKCKDGTRYVKEQLHLAVGRCNSDTKGLGKKLKSAYEALPARRDSGGGSKVVKEHTAKATVTKGRGEKKERGGEGESSPRSPMGQDMEEDEGIVREGAKRKRGMVSGGEASTGMIIRSKKCREDIDEALSSEDDMIGKMDDGDRELLTGDGTNEAGASATRVDFEAVENVEALLNIPNGIKGLWEAYKKQCQVVVNLEEEKKALSLRVDSMRVEMDREKERGVREMKQMKSMLISLQRQMNGMAKHQKEEECGKKEEEGTREEVECEMEVEGEDKAPGEAPPGPKNGRGDASTWKATFLGKGPLQRPVAPQPEGVGSRESEGRRGHGGSKRVRFNLNEPEDRQDEGRSEQEGQEKDADKDGPSYAKVASEGRWQQDRARDVKVASEFSKPRQQPQVWHKVFLKWNPSKKVKEGGRKLLMYYAWRYLENAKINWKVKDISLRGNSFMELYVAGVCYEEVIASLTEKQYDFTLTSPKEDEDISKVRAQVINRLGGMMYRNKLVNLRECILLGFEDLREDVMSRLRVLEERFGNEDKAGRR